MTILSSTLTNFTDPERDPLIVIASRRSMRGNKGKKTLPKIALRLLVYSLGYRFRIHGKARVFHL
jgi:hypothetical protein